ncbi:MAG: response regulator transcription factor [Gammaproteobacteria bacterium]|nr:response regulator transcription factor [Gammaproteobacteria bacterium]
MKTLVLEDDLETATYLANGLKQQGHTVDVADDGRAGLAMALADTYDMMIVDRMLPHIDGLAVVKRIRAAGVKTPVLFLTALGGLDDRVNGLEAGADDYLPKPFAFSELTARINALARRPPLADRVTSLQVADLHVDLLQRTVIRAGQLLDLQPREFRLLEYLVRHANQVVTRTMLLEHVWEFHFDPHTNVVETHISRLRAKLDKPFDCPLIHTVRGAGYMLRGPQ